MKFFLMPKEPTWWVWLVTALLLAVGLAGVEAALFAAIGLSAAQSVWMWSRYRSFQPYPVQIRVAYTAFLLSYLPAAFRWMYWIPMLGTFALVLFGYCLMARLLSLAPWNRREDLTANLLHRTFCTAPVVGRAEHGLPAAGAAGGDCEREARIATLQTQKLD
jgi:hypothetical protein